MKLNFNNLTDKKTNLRARRAQNAIPKSTTGFTIIEMLVVVAIAALLLSFVLVLVSDARARSRDARREEDIKQLENALNIYNVNNRLFPQCAEVVVNGSTDCMSSALLSDGISGPVSTDPFGSTGVCGEAGSHVYCYSSSDGFSYVLKYNLETDTVPGKSSGWQFASP